MAGKFSQCIGKCRKKLTLDPGHSNDIYCTYSTHLWFVFSQAILKSPDWIYKSDILDISLSRYNKLFTVAT